MQIKNLLYTHILTNIKIQDPLFEEGDIFKTIIPLKKIATQKVGEKNHLKIFL
ncbi:hypothetical protein GIG_02383 [Mycoplasmopsis anatis 1340]|uniref:Uncharacterized protein n=1 Tax=Mycoplasmopsis anatis 1340 TaxID=1034808 RepID=F9QDG9_9BACT|nr:hypothetical protein GIG_02383 [Mycoplasmopsis anatis 1340]